MWRIIPLILLQLPKTQIKNIIKMVLKTQNNAVAGHGQGATIAHLLALNPTTSGNHKIWQETNHFQKSQDCHTYMHIFQSLSHLRLSNCVFVPQSCSAKWSSRAEARCVREAWTLRLFPILLRRTPTHPTSHHPQPLQQGGKSNHSWYLLLYFSSPFFSSFTWNW